MPKKKFSLLSGGVLLTVLLAVSTASGEGFKFKGVDIRWDNTIKYSTAFRVAGPDANLYTANTDDSHNNFPKRSFFTNRADLLSEFDIKTRNFAIRISGAGWYDSIYATSNNNTSSTSNNFSVASYHFTKATREYAARRFELLDAFAFVRKEFSDGQELSMRVGRHTVNYGQGLMMPSNELSFGQAPLDANKAAIAPNTTTKELLMPVGQVSLHIKPTDKLSVDGYWQFEQRKSTGPAAGTYFSPSDFPDIGGERLLSGGNAYFRGQDIKAANSGNFGAAVYYRLNRPHWELGGYFHQANARSGIYYLRPGANADPTIMKIGEFVYVYPEHIKVAGASLGSSVGPVSVQGELSFRWNMPLVSKTLVDLAGTGNNNSNPLYAIGNTAHANISFIWVTGSVLKVFNQASLAGQVGYNHLMKITKNPQAFNTQRSTDAYAFALSFSLTKFQVLPKLDMGLPFTIAYSPRAKAAMDSGFNGGVNRGGNFSQGVGFTYAKVWRADAKYVHYWGSDKLAVSGTQMFRGKDFVSISLQRTF